MLKALIFTMSLLVASFAHGAPGIGLTCRGGGFTFFVIVNSATQVSNVLEQYDFGDNGGTIDWSKNNGIQVFSGTPVTYASTEYVNFKLYEGNTWNYLWIPSAAMKALAITPNEHILKSNDRLYSPQAMYVFGDSDSITEPHVGLVCEPTVQVDN